MSTSYCNTASSGGDGTTNATSGANAAYASQNSAAANMGGSATTHYILECCGATADTVAVTWDFATNLTTGSLTIRGNRGDGAGYYTGGPSISTSHYRLDVSSTACMTLVETNTIIDGIQLIGSVSDGVVGCVNFSGSRNTTIKNCRMRSAGSPNPQRYGIFGNGIGTGTVLVENNLLIGFGVRAIYYVVSNFFNPTINTYHNTVYGDETAAVGIYARTGANGGGTMNVKGNAFGGSGSDNDIDIVSSGTVNYDDNVTSDYNLGTNGEIALGTASAAWTSPGTSGSSNFTLKDASSSLYRVVAGSLVTHDINGNARGSAPHDAGCFHLAAAAAVQQGRMFHVFR